VESLSWTSWPMLRSPVRAVLAVAFVAVMAWFIQNLFKTTYFTIVAVLLVWGQIAGFFLPTRFALSEDGVSVRGLVGRRSKPWSEFRSWYIDREGLLLSPFTERSRLERFRGVSLQFHGNKDAVVAFVERVMHRETPPGEGGGGDGPDETADETAGAAGP
jgi:hypothetical protein